MALYPSPYSHHFTTSYLISMASTSSVPINYKYDLFLSFRGEDTRNSFTDHLYEALRKAGITTFRDEDEIHEGQELKPEIKRSIIESRASIIVFSENFANSSWCLEELWLILKQKKKGSHFVLPVFYGVDPSDIRNQRKSFTIEAKDGADDSIWTNANVERWKATLTEVANLKGMVVSGSETAFVTDIVHKIYRELDLKLLNTPTSPTGIKTRVEDINSWLKCEQDGSPVLAICGMGGSGKTTLAKYIYNSNKQNFESSTFLEEIENQPGALFGLQKQILRDVSGTNIIISNVSEGTSQIEKVIQRKKVLIVVDDIDDQDKLSTLFGTKVLHTKSKIIITTRLLNIDTWFRSISHGCRVHKIKLLNDDESLELLSCHAFGSKAPMEGFKELALHLAQYCEGNPLALKVLGSSLPVSTQDHRTRNNMIEIWRSRMNSLDSLKVDLDSRIQGVLRKSFESLPHESHKVLFLHIACLFVGVQAYYIEEILENDLHAKYGIMTLINRCLVTESRDTGRLVMHKLLQDMARMIVREEAKDPAKLSRVWRHEESYRWLSKGDGSEIIEGLVLNMHLAKQGMASETFKTSSLVKMKNLKFLQLISVKLAGSYENFPNLRWLRWHECNLKAIPSGLLMSSLVALDMRNGDLEKFEPPMVLNSLKILDLSFSYKLASVCSLHRLPKLKVLALDGCAGLTYVCKTIANLENLSRFYLAGCTKLWQAPSSQKFVNQLERLKALFIWGRIPEQTLFSLPKSLHKLNLSCNLFEILPDFIDLKTLAILDLSSCPNLKSLTCLPSTLQELHVEWCTSLERITFPSARFTLREFDYEGCFKLCEVEGLFKLVAIAKLHEADLGDRKWIKAYQDRKVDLVGDVITEGRTFNIQMLYEYGIRSTYLQGIKDQSMTTHEYTSLSGFLSFHVPFHPKKNRIQGLNVTILYKSSSSEERDMWPRIFSKISNKTKGLSWVYVPVVYCKPSVDNDVVWLSYWPIGNILDAGDEVHVDIVVEEGTIIAHGCGASLVYMDDGEVEKEEKCERMKGKEVIGGDLSLFEVSKGGYYLCRLDFFKSRTADLLKRLFGDNIQHTDSRRWRLSRQSYTNNQELNTFRNPNRRKIEVKLGVNFTSESETDNIQKAVSSLAGVESVTTHKETGRLIVCGRVDPQAVATCVREFEKMVQVLSYMRV